MIDNTISVFCEYVPSPLGIDCEEPRFSWIYSDERTGLCQTGYRVWVSEDAESLEREEGYCWDSGMVQSDKTLNVLYAGKSLESGKRYFYLVYITLSDGTFVKSGVHSFSIGLLDPTDWQASWVTGGFRQEGSIWLRGDLDIKKKPIRAMAYIAGLGYYIFSINGKRVGDHQLANAWTAYKKTILYETFDVTDNLLQGTNAIGISLGNGWFMHQGPFSDRTFGNNQAILQIQLEFEDGTHESFVTGPSSWYATDKGPIVYQNIYNGETYDATKEIKGWDTPEYRCEQHPETWSIAIETESPGGDMRAQMMEPIKIVKELKPIKIKELGETSYCFDFGQNFAGWARIRVRGARGSEIKMRFGEFVYEDGSINQSNLRTAKQTDTYILKGEGIETFEPHFTYHGFQYVQMDGLEYAPEADTMTGCVVNSAVESRGKFSCGNDLINAFHKIVLWTETSNLHGLPTDCPQRDERMGWLNDMTARAEEAMYNYVIGRLYAKWTKDIMDEQGEKGAIPDVAPYERAARVADAVCSSFLLVPWLVYLHYNDRRLLKNSYAALKKWTLYLKRNSTDFIVNYSLYGDWAGPVAGADANSRGAGAVSAITPGKLMSTGYLYYNCMLVSKMALALGNAADAEYFNDLAKKVGDSFNLHFFNEKTNNYATGSQASNTFPLYLGLVPEENKLAVLENLIKDIEAHENHLTTGNLCSRYMIEVLLQNGKYDTAYHLLTQDTYPSWGYMLANGATTVWERWENVTGGKLSAMGSHNHVMHGSVDVCCYKYLAGICVDESKPGFKNIIFRPYIPEKIRYVDASLDTFCGTIKVFWKIGGDDFSGDVLVPFNCTGTICLPIKDNSVCVFADDRKIWDKCGSATCADVEGIVSVEVNDKRLIIHVLSGRYCFRVQ